MTWDPKAVAERAAKGWRPYLWESFAATLARLPMFTREQAEEQAARKRTEACEDVAAILPIVSGSVTDAIREVLTWTDSDEACDRFPLDVGRYAHALDRIEDLIDEIDALAALDCGSRGEVNVHG